MITDQHIGAVILALSVTAIALSALHAALGPTLAQWRRERRIRRLKDA